MGVRRMNMINNHSVEVSPGEIKLSHAQQNYLIHGTYALQSVNGQKFNRILQVVGIDNSTGDLLILEKCSDDYPYKRMFVLSADGETKKYKGQSFLQVS